MITDIPKLGLRASATLMPATFQVFDPANPEQCLPAAANAKAVGVTALGTKYAPGFAAIVGGANVPDVAAIAGDPIGVYSFGQECLVLAGGPITAGDDLESDANANAVTSTVAGHNVCAVALQTVPGGSYCRVILVRAIH